MLGHGPISESPFLINLPEALPEPPTNDVRATQAAVLYLSMSMPDVRATQAVVLWLEAPAADVKTTQTAVLVLSNETPCLTRRAQLWKITRSDGEVFAYTTHDESITFKGTTYLPCDSLAATASSGGLVSDGAGDVQARGVFSDDKITARDLAGGLFDGAVVEVWEQTWDFSTEPGAIPHRITKGVLGKISQGDLSYTADLMTPGVRLQQRPLLDQYTPACRWELGDGRCPVDLEALRVDSFATAVLPRDAYNRTRHRIFRDEVRTEDASYFDNGNLTWLTGPNAGLGSEVKTYTADGWFTLWSAMPYEISPTDEYSVVPGCNKTQDDHAVKFALDMVDFGGFPDIPGTDAIIETPNAK